MQQCPKCGSVIPTKIQASFCGDCGASLIVDTRTHESSLAPVSSPSEPFFEPVSSPSEPSLDLVKKNYNISIDSITKDLISDLLKDFIKLKIIEESKFRILGLECLKCGSQLSLSLLHILKQ